MSILKIYMRAQWIKPLQKNKKHKGTMYCAYSLINVATRHGMSNPGLTLILTFSHQGRRNSDSSLRGTKWRGNLMSSIFFIPLSLNKGRRNDIIFFPRPFVGEGQGEGASFPSSSGVAKATWRPTLTLQPKKTFLIINYFVLLLNWNCNLTSTESFKYRLTKTKWRDQPS